METVSLGMARCPGSHEILGNSLRAVLTTGDTSSAIKELPRDPHLRIASKPINAEELLTLLRALLAA